MAETFWLSDAQWAAIESLLPSFGGKPGSMIAVCLAESCTDSARREADAVIETAEHLKLSEGSYRQLLVLLENPPAPNATLLTAAKAMLKPA